MPAVKQAGNMIKKSMIDNFVSLMRYSGRTYSCPDGFAFYLKLRDKQIKEIKKNPELLTRQDSMKLFLKQDGDNIHFIGIYGKKIISIRQGLKEIIKKEKPRSVSWYNKDMTKFIFRRIP